MEKLTIREMKATDVFKLTSIISKIGIKQFKDLFNKDTLSTLRNKELSKDERNAITLELALGVVDILLANVEKCEESIYRFLASLCEVEKAEIENLKGIDFFNLLIEVFTHKDFLDFFKVALRFQK